MCDRYYVVEALDIISQDILIDNILPCNRFAQFEGKCY